MKKWKKKKKNKEEAILEELKIIEGHLSLFFHNNIIGNIINDYVRYK